jgi:hypothetical protein
MASGAKLVWIQLNEFNVDHILVDFLVEKNAMKLTISVDGHPAAIDGILVRILEQLRQGEALQFSATLHPERSLGVEGIVECEATAAELGAWHQGLGLFSQAQSQGLQGAAFDRWLIEHLKATDLPEETLIPIFAQLSALERSLTPRGDDAPQ